jgi:hypothetical protein
MVEPKYSSSVVHDAKPDWKKKKKPQYPPAGSGKSIRDRISDAEIPPNRLQKGEEMDDRTPVHGKKSEVRMLHAGMQSQY